MRDASGCPCPFGKPSPPCGPLTRNGKAITCSPSCSYQTSSSCAWHKPAAIDPSPCAAGGSDPMYAADHGGKLPARLEDLTVPIPIDPIHGKPFDYKIEGDSAVLRAFSRRLRWGPEPVLHFDHQEVSEMGRFSEAFYAWMNDLEPNSMYAPNGASDGSHGWSGAAAKPPPRNPWKSSWILPRPARATGK